jgi:hypothetical protein
MGFDSHSELLSFGEKLKLDALLIDAALLNVGKTKVSYSANIQPPDGAILLVSGSRSYTQAWSQQVPNPMLVLCDEHIRAKNRLFCRGSLRWMSLRHHTFGGATHFQAMLGTNIPNFVPVRTTLRRTLRHILEHSIKPRWTSPPSGDTNSSLCLEDRLHPSDLTKDIVYHTHYSATGWGIRCLSPDEVGIAFGWPAWARRSATGSLTAFPCVPLQILDGCLQGLLDGVPRTDPLKTPSLPPKPSSNDFSWLHRIQKFLPHSWIDSALVTDKAAKRDDAGVPTHLWDRRCSLVFPHLAPTLPILRKWLMRAATTRLWAEFHTFLTDTHGAGWREELASYKLDSARGRPPEGMRTMGVMKRNMKRKRIGKEEKRTFARDELYKDVIAGTDAVSRFSEADWWAWKKGSALFFWRWPPGEQRTSARDGMQIWIRSKLPCYQRKPRTPDPLKKQLILEKLQKILDRGYVIVPSSRTFIRSLMDFFEVDKDSDIRLVYNGTSCGLNDAIWAPNFFLPTPATAARSLGFGYYMVDIDLGEMFLNFPLHETLQRYSGVDFSHYSADFQGAVLIARVHWARCWMGFKPSPYMAVRFYYLAEEFARGNRRHKDNAMRWDFVKLNLPGDSAYDPPMPRVMKWDSLIENIAGDVTAFVDDLRASGHSIERAWKVGTQMGSRLQYLGLQDAPRKRKPPVRASGPWAGAVFTTTDTEVRQSVSQSKWDKAKSLIQELVEMMAETLDGLLDFKRLEQIRGFLCHISMTYRIVTPYLKGLHLTLASHHPGRNESGWKMSSREWCAYLFESVENGKLTEEEAASMARTSVEPPKPNPTPKDGEPFSPPKPKGKNPLTPPPQRIKPAPRLKSDARALGLLFKEKIPGEVLLRAARVYTIIYGFADASGSGFGSTIMLDGGIHYRIGTWGPDEDETSNFREFENVVDALREEGEAGHLQDACIFMCTDNSTVEAALVKGNSSSEKLFELTLEVRRLEMKHRAKVIVSHVAGERMKDQGTDGVSRGQLREGVSAGKAMMTYIPFHLDSIQRSPLVEEWLKSWLGPDAEILSPEGWFERGHDILGGKMDSKGFWRHEIKSGTFVWNPPPAAAAVALEQLRIARIKRQDSLHVFVCPRLMKPEWFRQLYKASDIVFDVPVGSPCWPVNMFEPLIVGILFPFISKPPWQLRGTPKMFYLGRRMREVWDSEKVDSRNILREFLLEFERLRSVPADVVRRMLFFESNHPVPDQKQSRRSGRKRKRSGGARTADDCLGEQASSRR